jgi:transcriptional regulator GlxA family with amidase domain
VPALSLHAQSSAKPLSVGIFVYPGVEILDFSGPAEVFAATNGFEPFVVALTAEPVISQGFVKITPQYSIDNCPPTDILVFPGGGTSNVIGEERMIQWIKDRAKSTQVMMSVCTGAALLSEAGLLEGKEVTTWYGFIPELQKRTPEATVLANTRFVDNGQIVTTAGVSAGIDGALHVVSRIKGRDVAKATAKYMEYDKWKPDEGKIIESPFMQTVREKGIHAAVRQHPVNKNNIQPQFYRGELINLAMSMTETNPSESEAIFKWLIKSTDGDPSLYDGLGMVWKKMGKATPVDRQTFISKLGAGDVVWAKETWQETMKEYPDWRLFTEDDINVTGYRLLQNGELKSAIDVFKWNTELFPASPNTWDGLADAYEASGDTGRAISASEECLAKLSLPGYSGDQKALLTKLSNERIARLKEKQ